MPQRRLGTTVTPFDYPNWPIYGSALLDWAMERMVRPFVSVNSLPLSAREAPEVKAPEHVTPPAFIRWGAVSDFDATFRKDSLSPLYGSANGPDTDPEPLKRVRISISEEGRKWQDRRVISTLDVANYIVVREAHKVACDGPSGPYENPGGGDQFIFGMAPQSGGLGTIPIAYGQEPHAPPPLEKMNENEDWIAWSHRHPF